MSAKDYKDAQELPLAPDSIAAANAHLALIREHLITCGYDAQAVGDLSFAFTSYTLDINDADKRSGAFHIYGDGNPFFEISVSALPNVGAVAEMLLQMDNTDNKIAHTGGSLDFPHARFTSCFRMEPESCAECLSLIIRHTIKLDITPAAAAPAQKTPRPPSP